MGQHNATITGKAYLFAIKLYPSNASRSNYDTVPASLGTIFTPAFTRNWAIETLCLFSQSRTGTRVGNIRMLQYDVEFVWHQSQGLFVLLGIPVQFLFISKTI